MPVEKLVEITESGVEHYELVCEECGKVLADVYYSGPAYLFFPRRGCQHYEWKRVGSYCREFSEVEMCKGVEELIRKAVAEYHTVGTVWLLVSRTKR